MFRVSTTDSAQNARLQQLLDIATEEFFAVDQTAAGLDFATIEQRAHEAGRKLACLLSEQAASQGAESAERPHPCPDCGQLCPGTIDERTLETRNGPITLEEARHSCPRCRRVFFPQSTAAGPGSPPL